MFPRSLGFLIVILIIDAFLKTARNRKESQEERSKRTTRSTREAGERDIKEKPISEIELARREERTDMTKKSLSEIYLERLEKSKDEKRNSLEKKSKKRKRKEISFAESTEIGDVIKDSEGSLREIRQKDSRNKLKKDLINGIIFSEIIGKPKSKQNKRKSI